MIRWFHTCLLVRSFPFVGRRWSLSVNRKSWRTFRWPLHAKESVQRMKTSWVVSFNFPDFSRFCPWDTSLVAAIKHQPSRFTPRHQKIDAVCETETTRVYTPRSERKLVARLECSYTLAGRRSPRSTLTNAAIVTYNAWFNSAIITSKTDTGEPENSTQEAAKILNAYCRQELVTASNLALTLRIRAPTIQGLIASGYDQNRIMVCRPLPCCCIRNSKDFKSILRPYSGFVDYLSPSFRMDGTLRVSAFEEQDRQCFSPLSVPVHNCMKKLPKKPLIFHVKSATEGVKKVRYFDM